MSGTEPPARKPKETQPEASQADHSEERVRKTAPAAASSWKFTISGRPLDKSNLFGAIDFWKDFVRRFYGGGRIDSIYTSIAEEFSPLYGGRKCSPDQCLTYRQVTSLNARGIGFMITLSNNYFTEEAYRQTIPILERINNPLNSATIANDELAKRLRQDFPQIKRKASVIRGLNTYDEIYSALDLYDVITLSPKMNTDAEFMLNLKFKDRMMPFANAGCLFRCRNPICYEDVSKHLMKGETNFRGKCSHANDKKVATTYVVFLLDQPQYEGFTNFKLVPILNGAKSKITEPEYL